MMCKDETLNTHPHDKICESSTQPHAATSAKADHKDEDMYVMYIVHGSKNSEHGSAKDAKQSLQTCRVCKQYCEALGFLGQDMSVDSYRCWMNKCSDLSEYCYISVKPDDRFRWHAVSKGTRHQPCLGPKVEIRHVVVTHFLLHTDSKFIALASRFDRKFTRRIGFLSSSVLGGWSFWGSSLGISACPPTSFNTFPGKTRPSKYYQNDNFAATTVN